MPRVLPCPFCGTEEVTHDPASSAVFCNHCHAEGGLDGLKSWNERSVESAAVAIMKHLRSSDMPEGAGEMFMTRLHRLEGRGARDCDEALRTVLAEALFCLSKSMARQADAEADAAERMPDYAA